MSSSARTHDVFLSFRGDDTRTNFTSHLHNALSNKSISTYIDYKIDKGEDVWPALARAIEESHVSIVVFSENYASSRWCLEELVKILECREKQGQVVIPVFYDVDPSDIRNQKGSYGKVFAKHERDPGGKSTESNEQKVSRWKAALTEAANISGWDSRKYRDESLVIENVVSDVLQKLHERYPTELMGLVGNEENCGNAEFLLNTCRVIGIWGMGGIGKSTIAKVLFAKHFPKYDHVCFVANAKEYSLDKLFSALLKEEVSTSTVVGSKFDMRRLSSKKVFIVLDDVNMDSLDPLEYLYREYNGQDRGSRLVITTRDKQLLIGRVDAIYEVKEWKKTESIKLFCLEAFKKSYPEEGYESLSDSAVKYAGGIPLALKVLGSYFYRKGIDFWIDTLKKLNTYPNKKIQNTLEVSYTGLDDLEKNIFLDIAFFFKEKEKDHVIRILNACGFAAISGIEVLADKALITISNSNTIQMHDLLQQMGLEIVREKCRENLGKRSRLKDNEALQVIEENKGTDAIQGIALDLSQIKDLPLRADTFTKMKALRFLKFYDTLGQSSSNTYRDLPATLEPLSDKLRYIEWIGYPFESLPSPFCAKFLVEIHMPHSKVKQLWQETQELDFLEAIQLSECKQLKELPDLSKAPRLKWVNLSCCESLQYLHPSILSSDTLVALTLDGCTKLKSVKGEKHLKSLEKISVNGCLCLEEFAVSSDLIENLDLSNTGIRTLDSSIGSMSKLKWLNLDGLKLGHLLKEQLHVLFDGLRFLLKLHMKDLSNLLELPDNISVLSQLQELRLDGSNVRRLPESIKNLEELEILSLENCKELLCLPKLPSRIKYLGAINCTSLVSVSNLKTLATKMLGMTKFITFKNSFKLDGPSCELIVESLQLTMMHAVFDNEVSRYVATHGYNYTSVGLCIPGSRVPRQITYRITKSSITIELPKFSDLLGFIYWVVLSPADGMKKPGTKIKCKCHLPEGDMKEAWLDSDIGGLNSDHVYVWYDPYHCDRILRHYEQPGVCFEFCVANDEGEVDGSICIKECGIRFVSVSELPSVLKELDWDSHMKKNFLWLVESATNQSIELSDEEESNDMLNQIGNQQRDLSEHSSDSIVGPKSAMDEMESVEDNGRKDHFRDVEESIGYAGKETKIGAGSRESMTEYTEDATEDTEGGIRISPSEAKSKSTSSTSCAQKIENPKEKQKSKPKSSGVEQLQPQSTEVLAEPTAEKGPNAEAENQAQPINVPEDAKSSLSSSEGEPEDPGQKELNAATSVPSKIPEEPPQEDNEQELSSREPSLEKEQPEVESNHPNNPTPKYTTPMDLDDYLNQVEEDPFVMLDFMSGQVSLSSKQSETSVQQSSTNENFEAVLEQLRELAFSESMLKNVGNPEYRKKLEAAAKKLENFPQELTEDLKEKINSFFDLYEKASEIFKEQQETCEKVAQVDTEKDADFDKLQIAKNQVKQLDDIIGKRQPKIDELEKREKDLEYKIKKLQEELNGVKSEKAKLETAQEKSITKKADFFNSAKQLSLNLGKLIKQKTELEKLQAKHDADFKALSGPYTKMRAEPPF